MRQNLTLVTLGVRDLSRARAFYEALGWTVTQAPDDEVVFFQAGGVGVALWLRTALQADTPGVEDSGSWGGVALAHNVYSPAEVDAVLAQAEAAGGTIGRSGAATFWGGYSGVFIDPDGHPWEVAHNPFWSLLADGSVRIGPDECIVDSLDHSVLTVADVDATCDFYERALGMERETFGDGRTALRFGAQKLNLHGPGEGVDIVAAAPTRGSADFCLLTSRPLAEVVDRVRAAGAEVELGPVRRTAAAGPITSVYFRDPDGNLVEVGEPIRDAMFQSGT